MEYHARGQLEPLHRLLGARSVKPPDSEARSPLAVERERQLSLLHHYLKEAPEDASLKGYLARRADSRKCSSSNRETARFRRSARLCIEDEWHVQEDGVALSYGEVVHLQQWQVQAAAAAALRARPVPEGSKR